MELKDAIIVLTKKKSKEYGDTVYGVAIFRMGNSHAEFAVGELEEPAIVGNHTNYVYRAEYYYSLTDAMEVFNNLK
ncbi:MAG: hypothetical protein FWC39_10255 [Bacteroidetes bacterium]|nr:hypothetical protein [Bacteroidota bacterium]